MKAIGLGLAISLVLACTGCNPVDDATAKKVAALEAKVGELEKRSNDLEFKGRMVGSHLLGSPLGDFFGSDEFWENTYDVGQAECAKRCTSELTSANKACDSIGDCARRQRCRDEAISRASTCQTRCSANNPPQL